VVPVDPIASAVGLFDMETGGDDDEAVDGRLKVTCFAGFLPDAA